MTEVFAPGVVISSFRMVRALRRFGVALMMVALVVLTTSAPHADERVARLGRLLLESDDFRVRTQAALALGASKSKEAVEPLCKGLDDASSSVRAASAAALGKLRKGGLACLRTRLPKENEGGSVRAVIQNAIERLEGAEEAPVFTDATQYYVAVEIADKSGREGGDVAEVVRSAMAKAAGRMPSVALAPKGEAAPQATKVLGEHQSVTGYLLSTKIQPPKYTGGALKVKVEVAIFTYPARALKGSYGVGLTQPGVSSPDVPSENELYQAAAERVMEKFLEAAARIN